MAWLALLILGASVVGLALSLRELERQVHVLLESNEVLAAARQIHERTERAFQELVDEAQRTGGKH